MTATLRRAGLLGIRLASALLLDGGIVAAAPAASPIHLVHDFFPGEFEGGPAAVLGTFPQVSDGGVGAHLGSVLGDTLFFGVDAPQGETPEKVWLTEGTAASTRPLPDPLSSLTAAAFFTAGDRRYFTACEAEHG